jgi:hypothetical protein
VVVVRRRQTIAGLLRGGDSEGEGAARAEQVFVGRAVAFGRHGKAAEPGVFQGDEGGGGGCARPPFH